MAKIIEDTSEIAISFTLKLMDDTIVDQTEGDEVFRLRLGQGEMLPKLEELLMGLPVGVEGDFIIPPEEGFGMPDPTNVYDMDLADFPEADYKVGDVIGFDTPTGDQIPGQIVELKGDKVRVDLNHPLAGQAFRFTAKIIEIFD